MVDAGNLADCLIGLASGLAKESILDKYCEIRREMWHKFINPISSANIIRMHPENLDHVLEDPFFIMLEEAKKDPEKMKQLVTVFSPSRCEICLMLLGNRYYSTGFHAVLRTFPSGDWECGELEYRLSLKLEIKGP